MKILEAITFLEKRLKKLAFVSNSNIEAKFLLEKILDCSALDFSQFYDQELSAQQCILLNNFIVARENKEPIAYITQLQAFWKYEFKVNDAVLIPRSDSETLIEAVLTNIKNPKDSFKLLDLGVGSGCLTISLMLELVNSTAVGLDISADALIVAKNNIDQYRLQDRITLQKSDWFEKLSSLDKFDIIISNPPYISITEINVMSEETLIYEPHIALFAEDKGLENYKIIANHAKNFLKINGRIYLEIGFNQAKSVKKIFTDKGYIFVNSYKDLGDIERCLEFKI